MGKGRVSPLNSDCFKGGIREEYPFSIFSGVVGV